MKQRERQWQPVTLGPSVPAPVGAYSPAVRAGPFVFVSGQVPRNPETGELVGEDVESQTRQVIAKATKPVLLVGHSYGGAVITLAGDDPKVKSLVYIAAYEPDVGESVYDLATRPHPGEEAAPLLPPADGFLLVDPAKFPTSFAADVDASTTRFMNASQVPWGLRAVQFKLTKAAWKNKPVHHMLTLDDHMIPPSLQHFMASRAKAKVVEIRSSHAVMLSHPKEVAAFIETAAADAN